MRSPARGWLASLGLVPLLNFLRTSQRAGCLNLTRNGWNGTLCLDGGRLVAASFGREHGPAALDAILLTLSEARFTFVDDLSGAEDIGGLAVDVDSLEARPRVPARQRELATTIPTPAAVPRIVPPTVEDRHDPTELVLRLGTLQTLLAVDGVRTVEELGDHSSAEVLFDLAVLMDLGLVSFDVQGGTYGSSRE